MGKVVTLGEIMLRLSPPGQSRIFQAQSMEVNYGGAEANVAVSLAQFGHKVSFVSRVPDNALGDAALGVLKKYNVDCSHIARGGERLGIYFLENGASVRPSSVVYDRKYSSFSKMEADGLDFDGIFSGCRLVPYFRDHPGVKSFLRPFKPGSCKSGKGPGRNRIFGSELPETLVGGAY